MPKTLSIGFRMRTWHDTIVPAMEKPTASVVLCTPTLNRPIKRSDKRRVSSANWAVYCIRYHPYNSLWSSGDARDTNLFIIWSIDANASTRAFQLGLAIPLSIILYAGNCRCRNLTNTWWSGDRRQGKGKQTPEKRNIRNICDTP